MKKWLAASVLASSIVTGISLTADPAQATVQLVTAVNGGVYNGTYQLNFQERVDLVTFTLDVQESIQLKTTQDGDTSLVAYQLIDSNGEIAQTVYVQSSGVTGHSFTDVPAGTYTLRVINMTVNPVSGEVQMLW